MPSYQLIPQGTRFSSTLQSYTQGPGLPFADVLTEEQIDAAAAEEDCCFASGADSIYTPAITLWAFLSQALSGSQSCVAAVARVMVLLVALGRAPGSAATGGYCKARAKLPEALLQRLTYAVGTQGERIKLPLPLQRP
jgi:hypothetical protein